MAVPMRVCPELTEQLVMGYLEPLTESGLLDPIYREIAAELAPLARAAAERAMSRHLQAPGDEVLVQLRRSLSGLADRLQSGEIRGEEAALTLRDWVYHLDTRLAAGQALSAVS